MIVMVSVFFGWDNLLQKNYKLCGCKLVLCFFK